MKETIKVVRRGKEVTISITGDFVFDLNVEFRKVTESIKKQGPADLYTIDFAGIGRLDSSALGMMMIFFGAMGGDKEKMRIINASPGHRRILAIALFESWFRIE